MKAKVISLYVAGLLIGGSLTALGASSTASPSGETPVGTVHQDIPLYKNIADLSRDSEAVFVGTILGVQGKRNLAINPSDPTQEDPNLYIEGIDYKVSVTEFLKGNGNNQVLVTEEKQTRSKRGDLLQFEEFQELHANETYVFFVKKALTGEYFGAGQPFLFEVKKGAVFAKTKLSNLAKSFANQDLESLKKEIK